MRPARLLAAAALAVAAFGTATPANAVVCAGTQSTFIFCVDVNTGGLPSVDPTGGEPIEDCVYLGPPPCKPVSVPRPSVTPGSGNIVYLGCGGDIGAYTLHCESPI